jgi:hypothetical protein
VVARDGVEPPTPAFSEINSDYKDFVARVALEQFFFTHRKAPVPPVGINPDVPHKLEEVINKSLEKDCRLRYQHASEIRTDLQRLKRDTESTRIVAWQHSPGKTLKRYKLWVVLPACIVGIGLVVAASWYLRSGTGARIDSIAVLPFTNVGGDASKDYISDGVTESLIASLTHVPELKVKSRSSVFRYKGKDVVSDSCHLLLRDLTQHVPDRCNE